MFAKKYKALFAFFTILGLVACAAKTTPQASSNFSVKFNQLETGMAPEQVKSLLGDPQLREAFPDGETWHYNIEDGRQIEFKDKKVISFSREKNKNSEIKTSEIPAKSKMLGDKCNSDEQCQTEECHMGHCVGKNYCFRSLGQTCGNNRDCCDGRCDFDVCKPKFK